MPRLALQRPDGARRQLDQEELVLVVTVGRCHQDMLGADCDHLGIVDFILVAQRKPSLQATAARASQTSKTLRIPLGMSSG